MRPRWSQALRLIGLGRRPFARLHYYTGACEGRQTSAERVSGRGAHRHTPMTAAAEDWTRKVLSGWREHRPSYKVNRQDKTRQDVPLGEDLIDRDSPRTATACLFVRDGSCSTRCWASKQGVHRAPRVATVLNLSTQPRASNNAHGRTHARKILLVNQSMPARGSKKRVLHFCFFDVFFKIFISHFANHMLYK